MRTPLRSDMPSPWTVAPPKRALRQVSPTAGQPRRSGGDDGKIVAVAEFHGAALAVDYGVDATVVRGRHASACVGWRSLGNRPVDVAQDRRVIGRQARPGNRADREPLQGPNALDGRGEGADHVAVGAVLEGYARADVRDRRRRRDVSRSYL